LDSNFKIESIVSKLKGYLKISESQFIDCSQQVLDLAKNFESRFSNLTNLSKFHSFSLESGGEGNEEVLTNITYKNE